MSSATVNGTIPPLLNLFETIIPNQATIEGYEVERDFPTIGRRTMLLNAHRMFCEGNGTILIAIEDVTQQRRLEREKAELLRQKNLRRQEMDHVDKSLQIIAGLLLLKTQTLQSAETHGHQQDAREGTAFATLKERLYPAPFEAQVEMRTYLTKLCESLATSVIPEGRHISLHVEAGAGSTNSEQAVSMGLIATELVMNALRHAFPGTGTGDIVVGFESNATVWRLSVSDNGVGITTRLPQMGARIGLGTSIVEALTRRLGGQVTTSAASPGTTVSVTAPRAA
jgi:chemotaxis protein methyltransferase CheR